MNWNAIKQIKAKHDCIPWKEFKQTTLVTLDGAPWRCLHASHDSPVFIITACCPYSLKIDGQANQYLHCLLKQYLDAEFPWATVQEIVGQSADKQWQELSWAVAGISKNQALGIGRLFHQWAIFVFDGKEKQVLRC
jgi:hypothetical protein